MEISGSHLTRQRSLLSIQSHGDPGLLQCFIYKQARLANSDDRSSCTVYLRHNLTKSSRKGYKPFIKKQRKILNIRMNVKTY